MIRLLLLSVVFSTTQIVSAQEKSRLTLEVEGTLSENGKLRAALFDSPDGFPDSLQNGQQVVSEKVNGDTSQLIFDAVPFGEYAIVVFHDENNNGLLDKNSKGIPLEPIGVSNNAKMKLGPPKFDRCTFVINAVGHVVEVSLQKYNVKE